MSRPIISAALPSRIPAKSLIAAIPPTIAGVGSVPVPLVAAQTLDLSAGQTATWIMLLYGFAGMLSLGLTFTYRQPLLVGWNVTCIIFLTSLAGQVSFPEMLGATAVTGAIVFLLGVGGLSTRLAALIPAPIIYGVVAGAIMPFIINIFTELPAEPLLIGSMLAVFLFSPRLLSTRIPALVYALVVGVIILAVTGRLARPPGDQFITAPELTWPAFSVSAIITIVPVFVALIALQGNLAAIVYLRAQRYHPPARIVDGSIGTGLVTGAAFAPTVVSMASAIVALTAGPEAGAHRLRHWSVYGTGVAFLLTALFSGLAANIPAMIPLIFLLVLVGLAVVSVVQLALKEISHGPLRLGPLFAFVVALSDMTLFDLGPLFWSLVIGTAVSLTLERSELQQL